MPPQGERFGLGQLRLVYIRIPFVVLLGAIILAGCSHKTGPIAQEQTNLAWLGSMYRQYIGENKGRAPKSVDELQKFVEKVTTAEQLTRLKVANAKELFVSPRDGKPFAMVSYSKMPTTVAGAPPPIVLYEAQGQNGQRGVAFLGGGTKSVDESDLQKMLPAQTKPSR
jgi:hypothetical protein